MSSHVGEAESANGDSESEQDKQSPQEELDSLAEDVLSGNFVTFEEHNEKRS